MGTRTQPDRHRSSSIPALAGRVLKRAFPIFYPGWMLFYSLLFSAVVFMAMNVLDWLSSALISTTGHAAITSANFRFFLRSWQGYALAALIVVFLGVTAAIIMNGIILLSDDMLCGRQVNFIALIRRSVTSIRLFLCREAVPIILYYYVFVIFFTISLLSIVPNPFEIPGYIRYLLSKRLWAMALYFAAFILVCIPILRNPLLLHDILLKQERPLDARRRTRTFAHDNRRFLSRELLLSVVVFCVILLAAAAVFLYLPLLVQTLLSFLPAAPRRVFVLFSSYLGLVILLLAVLLSLWILPAKISFLYRYMIHGTIRHPAPAAHRRFFVCFLPAVFVSLAVLTAVSFLNFNYFYPPAKHIEAVVHRLGGDLDTENTLEGMEKALALGAPAMETDIQRTKDGEYVIFHDSTLKRMAGMKTKINEMTLDEVLQVPIQSYDLEERHIPLLSEVLDRAKGKTRLYLELKGVDADERMARDVANMVRRRSMEEECVLISLNYNLISYISRRIPDIQCGYLYFFAYGTPARLAGNILMAQSNAISQQRTRAIHSRGKRMYCWTVNSRQTALNMVRQRVDGIITDRYDIVESVLSHMESRNDYERIMDVLLS